MARNEKQLPSPILSGKPSGVRGLPLSPAGATIWLWGEWWRLLTHHKMGPL